MPNDSPDQCARKVWLNQPTEKPTLLSKLIGQRSRELRARTRRKLIGTLAGPLSAGILCVFSLVEFPALKEMLQPVFALAIAWSLAGLYYLNRGMWSEVTPREAGRNTGLQACQLEIERQRNLIHRFLVWSFGPSMLAIAAFVFALAKVSPREHGILPNGLPFLILMVVWIISWSLIRMRERRDLDRQIVELKNIETENDRSG